MFPGEEVGMVDRSPPEATPVLLSPGEVAQRLSVSVRTLYRLVKRGQVPAPIRFNCKLVRWLNSDIQHYLEGLYQCRPSV
jgi:excisionase family DNA binding protein